mmetsp:Transcript_2745/g.11760  ORF Transcript_2745/g.11760 Transcript_2745/m.11760 type:complete len:238 (+) Transcript_2745:521-1234(+)
MGYVPLNADRRKISLGRKRIKYTHLAEKLDNDILGSDDLVLLHQIQIDLPRTVVYREFLEHAEIRLAVQRVLFTRALRNPTSSYVQGMNELVVPFLIAFLAEFQAVPPLELDVSEITTSQFHVAEADSYWCFCKFLGVMQNHYTFGQPGIQESCFKVKELLKRADSELYEHLTNEVLYLSTSASLLVLLFRCGSGRRCFALCVSLVELPFSPGVSCEMYSKINGHLSRGRGRSPSLH